MEPLCCLQVKSRVKLEGEELERYLEAENDKEKSRQVTETAERRCVQNSHPMTKNLHFFLFVPLDTPREFGFWLH